MKRLIRFCAVVIGLGILGYMAADHYGLLKSSWDKTQDRAKNGDVAAQYYVARVYDGASVSPKSEYVKEVTAYWYRKAAEQGHAEAQSILGIKCVNGEGTPKDLVEGYAWLLLASAGGVLDAGANLEKIEPQLTEKDRDKARRWAEELSHQIKERKNIGAR